MSRIVLVRTGIFSKTRPTFLVFKNYGPEKNYFILFSARKNVVFLKSFFYLFYFLLFSAQKNVVFFKAFFFFAMKYKLNNSILKTKQKNQIFFNVLPFITHTGINNKKLKILYKNITTNLEFEPATSRSVVRLSTIWLN